MRRHLGHRAYPSGVSKADMEADGGGVFAPTLTACMGIKCAIGRRLVGHEILMEGCQPRRKHRHWSNMKTSVITVLIFVLSGISRADELPFSVNANVPDYIATMTEHRTVARPLEISRIVKQHAGWTFVEEKRGDDTTFAYGGVSMNVVAIGGYDGPSNPTWISVRQSEPSLDYYGVKSVLETNDMETVAGESCGWRGPVRGSPQERKSGPVWLSCLTKDGIEIASKVLFSDKKLMSETRLTDLKRVPVAKADVSPPGELFDASFWLKPFGKYPEPNIAPVDFDARFVSRRSEVRLLRHYPWFLRERHGNDGSAELTVWNALENQGLSYQSSMGSRTLQARREHLDPKSPINQFDMVFGKVDMGRKDRYLGEDCMWFDVMPKVSDGGRTQCVSRDDIPLKDVQTSRGSGEEFEIVSLKRRPVEMRELKPPEEYLDPAKWGFPISTK